MPDSHQSSTTPRNLFAVLAAGAILLLVTHGLGRFIYTPLLPYLIEDGQITTAQAASVATWNYLGYLLGALLAVRWHRISHIRTLLPTALVVHLLTTLVMTQTDYLAVMSSARLFNGIANGIVFVQAPALILEWLTRQWLEAGGNLTSAFGIGVGALAFGVVFLFFVPSTDKGGSPLKT